MHTRHVSRSCNSNPINSLLGKIVPSYHSLRNSNPINSLLGKTVPSYHLLRQLRYHNKQDTHLNIEVEFAWFAFVVKRSFWLS